MANYGKKTRLDLNKRQVLLIVGSLEVMQHETWDEDLQVEIGRLINTIHDRSLNSRSEMSSLLVSALKQNGISGRKRNSNLTPESEQATTAASESPVLHSKRPYKRSKKRSNKNAKNKGQAKK